MKRQLLPILNRVSECLFVSKADGYKCPQCGLEVYTHAGLVRFDEAIATYLLRHGFNTYLEACFLRKTVGIVNANLAAHGIVHEPNKDTGVAVRFVIAVAALQKLKLPIPSYLQLLRLVNTRVAPKRIRLRAPARKRRGSG
jgi:hypothetical protein